MNRHLVGRHTAKVRTGCWTCKKRKVKCSEERPVCRGCARLQLQCQYDVRLKWNTEDADKTIPSNHVQSQIQSSRQHGAPIHFVHFTAKDFEHGGGLSGESGTEESGWSPQLEIWSTSPGSSSSSPSSDCLIITEPSWFPPLEVSSPLDETLFMYYVIEICPRCTMYDDSSNGFRSIIIPMSATHQSIMHSILAVAAFYLRRHKAAYEVVSLKQKENALVYIRSQCFGDVDKDYEELIAVAIMLCVFEVKDGSGPDWAKHLYGGRSILESRVHKHGSQAWADGLSWWANKFFGYLTVNGAATHEPQSPALLEMPEFWLSQGFGVEDIDGFMGCSSELMAMTATVCALARTRYNHGIGPEDLEARGSELECHLYDTRQKSAHLQLVLQENIDLEGTVAMLLEHRNVLPRAKILALTAEARRQATFILLYICVQDLPSHRPEVQQRVKNCLLCIVAVAELMAAEDSPIWGMTPLVWPLFIAGASALGDEERFQVVDVFENLRRTKCLGNVARAEATVKTIWKQYDMEATELRQSELWRLYVDPDVRWPLSLA